jgi:cytidylate kinase
LIDIPRVIALDGPAGSGKSTLARLLARELGWTFFETGAIYRALAVRAAERGVSFDAPERLADLIDDLDLSFRTEPDGSNRVLLGGHDVTVRCYSPEVSNAASRVSAWAPVRERLVHFQRDAAQASAGLVMEGRDIGTVIVPDAPLKVFVTATPEERARRREAQLAEAGRPLPFEQVLADVIERDRRDTERESAPLRQADDAVLLDTTGMPLPRVIAALVELARSRGLTA